MPPTTPVTTVVVTHDSAAIIGETLRAVIDDPAGPAEIVVVDSGSTDDTAAVVARYAVRWYPLGENVGYGAAVTAGFGVATHDVVAVLNHDVTVRAGWLPPLVEALTTRGVGAAMPTIELADRPGHFNTSGGHMTVTGMAWITDLGKPIDGRTDPVIVPFPSGAAFAMRREIWNELGGMRADLFLYHEDADLGWRLRMRGLCTVRVPGSVVAHDYRFDRTAGKLRLIERNRWLLLLTNYRRSTLLLLTPVLALHELGILWVALKERWLGEKIRTWGEIIGRRRDLKRRYRTVQGSRVVGDAMILRGAASRIADIDIPGVRVPHGARIVDTVTRWWVRVIVGAVTAVDRRRGLTG